MKYLIWLVVVLAVVVWLKRLKKSLTARTGAPGAERKAAEVSGRPHSAQPETMVQCAHCGIHFPASEAVTSLSGAVFCSTEHLRLASR
jgi:uncharacterized protein